MTLDEKITKCNMHYSHHQQTMVIPWGNAMSASFHVSNGVRQGGILSPEDSDISRQHRQLYVQGTTLVRKFSMSSPDVKVRLFRAYCSSMYTSYLWCQFKTASIRKLYVANNDAMRILLGVPIDFFVQAKCLLK